MVRNYKKKTTHANWSVHLMKIGVYECQSGKSISTVAKKYNLPYTTLCRSVRANRTAYNQGRFQSTFSPEHQAKLVEYFHEIDRVFFGMTRDEFRVFAYQYAQRNNILHRPSWVKHGKAGEDWLLNFASRHPSLCFKRAESGMMKKLENSDSSDAQRFYRNLCNGIRKNKINVSTFYHMDECGISVTEDGHGPPELLVENNKKEIKILSNAECTQMMTAVCCCNASGNFLPPYTIFSSKKTPLEFDKNNVKPSTSTNTGWTTAESFFDWLKFFVEKIRPTREHKVLLLVDNDDCYKRYLTLDYANENNVIIVSTPPNANPEMTPLKTSFYDALKTCFRAELKKFRKSNPQFNDDVSQYDIAKIFSAAHEKSVATENAMKTFDSLETLHKCALKFRSEDLEESKGMELNSSRTDFRNFSEESCRLIINSKENDDDCKTIAYTHLDSACAVRIKSEDEQNDVEMETLHNYQYRNDPSSISDVCSDLLGDAAAHIPFYRIDVPKPTFHVRRSTFSRDEEAEFVECFTEIDRVFFGLNKDEFRMLVYQYAREKDIVYRSYWDKEEKAGEEWYFRFMIRNPDLSLKLTESCSPDESFAQRYYTNLCNEIEKNNINASTFYNMEECGILVTKNKHGSPKIFTENNKEEIKIVSTSKSTQMMAAVYCCNASGHFLPPFTIFSRKQATPKFEDNDVVMPNTSTNTGWINGESFLDWLKFFVEKIRPTSERKVLLLVDNYVCHKFYPALQYAKKNHVIIVSTPPDPEPVMVPLKVGFYDILKNCFREEVKEFLKPNRQLEDNMSQYDTAKIFSAAYEKITAKGNDDGKGVDPPKMWSLYNCVLKAKNEDVVESKVMKPNSSKSNCGNSVKKTRQLITENGDDRRRCKKAKNRDSDVSCISENKGKDEEIDIKMEAVKHYAQTKPNKMSFRISRNRSIFLEYEENELVEYFWEIDRIFFGMTRDEFKMFAYQYAKQKRKTIRSSWEKHEKAGEVWFLAFTARHTGMSFKMSESCSINKLNTSDTERFYNNLCYEIRENEIIAPLFYHMDGCEILVTENGHGLPEILTENNKKEIQILSTAENTHMITAVCSCNAFGHFLPPFTIFSRKQTPPKFDDNEVMPSTSTNTGWITGESFLDWLKFFVTKIRPTSQHKVLLLIDNYDCYKFYPALEYANENNVIIVSSPPNAKPEMVPLKASFHDALKNCFREEVKEFQKSHRQFDDKISQYDTAKIFSAVYERSIATGKVIKTFNLLETLYKSALEFKSEDLEEPETMELNSSRPNFGSFSEESRRLIINSKDDGNACKTVAYTHLDASCIVRIEDEDEQNDVEMETLQNDELRNDPLTADVQSDLLSAAAVHIPFETVDLLESVTLEPEASDEDPLKLGSML